MANTNNWTAIGAIAAVLAIVIPIGVYVFYIEKRIHSLEEKLGDMREKIWNISRHHDNPNTTLIKAGEFTFSISDQGIIIIDEANQKSKIICGLELHSEEQKKMCSPR